MPCPVEHEDDEPALIPTAAQAEDYLAQRGYQCIDDYAGQYRRLRALEYPEHKWKVKHTTSLARKPTVLSRLTTLLRHDRRRRGD